MTPTGQENKADETEEVGNVYWEPLNDAAATTSSTQPPPPQSDDGNECGTTALLPEHNDHIDAVPPPPPPRIRNFSSNMGVLDVESYNVSRNYAERDNPLLPAAPPPTNEQGGNNNNDMQQQEETFPRLPSSENMSVIIDAPWTTGATSVSGGGVLLPSASSLSVSNKPHSKKKAKDKAPVIPAALGDESSADRVRLGICAMDKKARSKPMAEILSRLNEQHFHVVFFGDNMILNEPVEDWPICDVVVAFFSKGYPLPKAKQYVALRKPFILNDLDMQELLQDRRKVYDLLEASGIDVPRHVYVSRDGYKSTGTGDGNGEGQTELQEFDDHIEINGVTIHKPFVEKPADAEDHNIAIYYPTSAGGGCKKLFRKIGNRSSDFYPEINEVRREGSYIYEEFVETQGTDVKMYTVGPEYGHAEARKSPTVDGKVERNSDGKEVRFPVILTYREKEIARRIVLVFKQFVCGFDILRVQEGHSVVSYVCDVNGWSFVKNSRKYYDDCAQILSEHILAIIKPNAVRGISTLDPLVMTSINRLDDEMTDAGDASVVAPPAPAVKMNKFLSRAARLLQGESGSDVESDEDDNRTQNTATENDAVSLQSHHDGNYITAVSPSKVDGGADPMRTTGHAKATTLEEGALPVREFPNKLSSEPASLVHSSNSSAVEDFDPPRRKRSSSIMQSHQEELRCVIAIVRHGDRTPKQKLKLDMDHPLILQYFHSHSSKCTKELKVKAKAPLTEFLAIIKKILVETKEQEDVDKLRYKLMHMRDILERWKIVGLNRKLQIKPLRFEDVVDEETGQTKQRCAEVLLILKWGGNLTKLGEKQAIQLGHRHRHDLYPDAPGGGILRLHSTFRHDLKIKTSDEGRVMKTAAAFAKGLLELEGDLPPILVSLVHKEKGSMHMLDPSGNKEVKKELEQCKDKITANLQRDIDVRTAKESDLSQLVGPPELSSLRSALYEIQNPRKVLQGIHEIMGELIGQLEDMLDDMGSGDEKRIEGGEGLRGSVNDDVALSGVKLYKGETLLELTERWRFLYKRLYDPEKDEFDLSRIPDVHDNVRFDVLHNPHLGLSNTLQKLYKLAKLMADCVVPQEYGTTASEKRSVGLKICHGLLEKIAYDLRSAREDDSNLDIRYLINFEYSKDLNINSMGRRIRTRLYFTSESHLHTVLNVFRFAQIGHGKKSLLSPHGRAIVNSTPELCYLTQVVIRVFEDNQRPLEDPRRFRMEILFSPGATATPMHMNEMDREQDQSRFDTAPLQLIGREGLTCQEVEEFFEHAIVAGRSDEESYDIASSSTATDKAKKSNMMGATRQFDDGVKHQVPLPQSPENGLTEAGFLAKEAQNDHPSLPRVVETNSPPQVEDLSITPDVPGPEPLVGETSHLTDFTELSRDASKDYSALDTVRAGNEAKRKTTAGSLAEIFHKSSATETEVAGNDLAKTSVEGEEVERSDSTSRDAESEAETASRKARARKYFWGTVAVASFGLGISCLIMALTMSQDARRSRRWTKH